MRRKRRDETNKIDRKQDLIRFAPFFHPESRLSHSPGNGKIENRECVEKQKEKKVRDNNDSA